MAFSVSSSDSLAIPVCEALGIKAENTSRIIIDLQAGNVVKVYVEVYGTKSLLDVRWDSLKGAQIVQTKQGAEE